MTNEKIDERRSDRDLLVRIDERVAGLSGRLKAVEEAILSVAIQGEKVKTLERMVYGAWAFLFVQGGAIGVYIVYNVLKDKI